MMKMNKKNTIIFDMDGVIFDSEAIYMEELIEFFKMYNIDLSIDECQKVIGVDSRLFNDIVYSWWQNKTSKEEFIKILNHYYDSIERDYKDILKIHVVPLLKYLKENHYKIALASSSSEQLIYKALTTSGIIDYFDIITSGNIFKESKPNPEIYLYTIEKLQVSKTSALIIEDSTPGIQAAINAGIDVIALKDDRFSIDQSQANHIIDDLLDVKKYI